MTFTLCWKEGFEMQTLSPGDVMVGLMHSDQHPWREIVYEGQFKTWVPVAISEGFEVIYCYGKKPSKVVSRIDSFNENMRWNKGTQVSDFRNIANRILAFPFKNYIPTAKKSKISEAPRGVSGLEVNLLDLYATGRWKQLVLINYFLNETQCRYLVISTSAAYLKTKKMLMELAHLPGPYVYSGPLYGNSQDKFVSGAQIVIDREFAYDVIRFRRWIPTHTLNDLGLGVLARRLSKEPSELPTVNVGSLSELRETSLEVLEKNYHFRLKSVDELNGKRNDVDIFLELHRRIRENDENSTKKHGAF
jgi:hypothetical protein